MLDIGEGTGALVVYATETVCGQEIEIRLHGEQWTGLHTAVRARHVGATVHHAGIFGSLPAGVYDVRIRPATAGAAAGVTAGTTASEQSVVVASGAVAEIRIVPVPRRR